MALKSSREGLRKELVDYLGNIIIDDNLRNEIVKVVGDKFVTPEVLNENVNNLTMQITTESGERIEADDTLQNNITAEATAREEADTILQNNINAETTARQEAITNLEEMIGTSGLQIDLLWTNASPASAFAPQTISLDLSQYKFVYIVTKRTNSNDTYHGSKLIKIGESGQIFTYIGALTYREVTMVNQDGITFGAGAFNGANNDYGVPIYIYGVR